RDFKSLEIELPDRLITLTARPHQGQTVRSWSATRGGKTHSAEQVAAVLERLVPRERVDIDSADKPPSTMQQWHTRRAQLARQQRDMRNMRRIMWVAGVLMMLISMSDYHRGVFALIGMLALCGVLIGLLFLIVRHIERSHHEQIAKLEAQMPRE